MSGDSIEREVDRQLAVMKAGSAEFFGEEDLRERLAAALREGRPLRVKLGMDPSSPDLHLGHCVVLAKLKRFLDLGHTPIFLIGDFTARIGDPSGKKKTRPPLSEEDVRKNAETYVDQVARILDVSRVEIRFNTEWMNELRPSDFVVLCSHYTIARLLERDDFAKRYAAGIPIFAHEFLYPFVQAYDSVALRSDVELGGSDQTFNLLMAREIQRSYGQPPQAVITHPLLVGTDGHEKMSKSLGNAIGITESAEEMYGKLMSISDSMMCDYFDLLSADDWASDRVDFEAFRRGEGDPLALKHRLASRVVDWIHGLAAARDAAEHFRRVVQRKEVPDEVPEHQLELGPSGELAVLQALEQVGLIQSRGEGRRLISQGAVRIDEVRVSDPFEKLQAGSHLLQVGKRRYARLLLRP